VASSWHDDTGILRCVLIATLIPALRPSVAPRVTVAGQVTSTAVPVSAFDPEWSAGDTWQVEFSYGVDRVEADLHPPGSSLVERVYRYTVLPGSVDEAFPDVSLTRILIEPELDDGDWILTFDADRIALLRVERLHRSGNRSTRENPFVAPPQLANSWMHGLHEFGLTMIHDFPRLLGEDDPTTDLAPARTGTAAFDQELQIVHPGGVPRLRAVFTRADPGSGLEHRTTVCWDRGRKWWSSARVELGGVARVTGALVP